MVDPGARSGRSARRAQVATPDGDGNWSHGEYQEIVPDRRIDYTFAWDTTDDEETTISLTLSNVGTKTRLSVHQGEFDSAVSRDSHADGWNVAFTELDGYLATAQGR